MLSEVIKNVNKNFQCFFIFFVSVLMAKVSCRRVMRLPTTAIRTTRGTFGVCILHTSPVPIFMAWEWERVAYTYTLLTTLPLFSQWPMLSNDHWCGLQFGLKRLLSPSTFPAVREPRRLQACYSPAHCWMACLLLTGRSIWAQEARDAKAQTSGISLPLDCPAAPGQTSAQPSRPENRSIYSTQSPPQKKCTHTHTHTCYDCFWNCAQHRTPVIFKSFFDLSSAEVVKLSVYHNGWNKVITYELTAFSKIMNLTYSDAVIVPV